MISLHMVVCMACLYHQGVAGYAVQFRFEKWAQDHRLSPGLSVDLECIIEGDDLGEVKNESVPVVITRTAHEITDATPPPPTNGNTNQETTQNVSSGLIVDPLFSQMASPPYTITKNDSAANMIMYTLSIPSLHLADSATWNCMVGDVIRPLTMEVGEAPSKVEIFFVTEVSTVPMGPAGSASPATAINGTFPLNASITVNDTGINLAFLAESSSNDSAGGGILAAQGNASVPSGEQGANGTGGMSPNDTSASGNDTGSTPRVLVSVPMTTDVSGVLKDGVAKITSEISTRIGCRVTGGNPQSKTEIYIGDAPTFPSSTMASFTWDTTTPGFRFPRFEHETIVEMEFSWVHDEKMFSCNAMTGTDRPDLNTNDSVKLDVKGRPAFIEDNCESIIIDVTSPPEFFTCSIYCHPACQFVRVSDAGGSLFDLEVSLSVLSDSNKDVEATLNIDDSFQFVNAYGSANSLKVWTVKVKVPQEERFLTEYNFVARNAYGDNNQLIRMQMPSTPRPGDGAGEETTPKKADGGRAGGGGPGAGPPATEPGASWSGDKTKDADASSGGNMILIIGVVVSLLVVGGIVAAIMLTKKKPEPQPSAAVARPTRPSATKMEDVHVDMDKGAAPPVAEEAGEGGEVEEKPEGEAPKEEEGETPAAEGEGEAAHEGEAAPETAPEVTPEGEAEPAAEAPPAEEAPPPEET